MNTTSIAIKARVRPALRLIETKQLSRAEWLASRKKKQIKTEFFAGEAQPGRHRRRHGRSIARSRSVTNPAER